MCPTSSFRFPYFSLPWIKLPHAQNTKVKNKKNKEKEREKYNKVSLYHLCLLWLREFHFRLCFLSKHVTQPSLFPTYYICVWHLLMSVCSFLATCLVAFQVSNAYRTDDITFVLNMQNLVPSRFLASSKLTISGRILVVLSWIVTNISISPITSLIWFSCCSLASLSF